MRLKNNPSSLLLIKEIVAVKPNLVISSMRCCYLGRELLLSSALRTKESTTHSKSLGRYYLTLSRTFLSRRRAIALVWWRFGFSGHFFLFRGHARAQYGHVQLGDGRDNSYYYRVNRTPTTPITRKSW